MSTSEFSGFYKLTREQRIEKVKEFADLLPDEVVLLEKGGALTFEAATRMIENVLGKFELPFAVAVNFLVNGRDYIVPLVLEEPSVVAAASNAARFTRKYGGFTCCTTGPIMRAQVQVVGVADPYGARLRILENKKDILSLANAQDPVLNSLGCGARDVEAYVLDTRYGSMVIVHLIVNTGDAMGANTVNTMAEAVAPLIEELAQGRVYLRILSNLADLRLVRARTLVDKEAIGGGEVVEGIVLASAFAEADPYRAATHNKGIMNGVDPVVVATGNDFRAVEAGAHAYAARSGRYQPLSRWEKDEKGNLVGTLEMPLAVGLVGGATKTHPMAKLAIKILGVKSAGELAEVIGAVGLAQNLAALRALATEGIQRGHMGLHARNIAVMAGAEGDLADKVAEIMVREKKIRLDYAKEILESFEHKGGV
jgi:hydroxymethylglutaryl-CoA reductase